MLSVTEIKELAKKTPDQVYIKVRSLNLQEAVKWVREFQEAQVSYSRMVGKYDGTAIRLQEIYMMVYRKVMRAYVLWATKNAIKDKPWLSKEKAKTAAKVAFGQFIGTVNY